MVHNSTSPNTSLFCCVSQKNLWNLLIIFYLNLRGKKNINLFTQKYNQ